MLNRATIKRSWTQRAGGRETSFAIGQVGGVKWEARSFGGRGGWEITTPLGADDEAAVRKALASAGGGRAAVEKYAVRQRGRVRRMDSPRRMEGDDE